jgi:Na+/H+ antiporter NhaD/arsenite permease-like protein
MHEVEPSVTYLFAGVLVVMVLALALEEKIHAKKSIITGTAAVVALFMGVAFHLLPLEKYIIDFGGGHVRHLPAYIPGVEWEVIAIILGCSLFVDVSSKSGMYSWVAIKLTRLSGGDPVKLLFFYGLMTVGFSALLNNVAAMLIVGSLTKVSLDRLGRQKLLLGFLITEALLTNVGGLLTLISSVPNIIVGKTADIAFGTFFILASPYVVVATIITILMGAWIFKIKPLADDAEKAEARELVDGFNAADTITSRGFFFFSGATFIVFVLVLSTTSVLPIVKDLGMGFVAMFFGLVLLLRFKSSADRKYAALDWDLLGFFLTLFIVIDVMEHAGVLKLLGGGIADLIGIGEVSGAGLLLVASALTSSVTDNIPLAAVLANILASLEVDKASNLWWCVIFGANLGGNFTPIGSASTVVAVTLMHKANLKLSFMGFVKAALPFATVHVILAVAYVLFVLPWLQGLIA